MLHFCNTNIYLTNELSNDIADEVWTTQYPACIDSNDGPGIYEGVQTHLINIQKDIIGKEREFFQNKHAVMLPIPELKVFVKNWYEKCKRANQITVNIDINKWFEQYVTCYKNYYTAIMNVDESGLGYFETLALYDLLNASGEFTGTFSFARMNVFPEISWMFADYLSNRNSQWKHYLTDYIRKNVRLLLYRQTVSNIISPIIDTKIILDKNISIENIDWSNKNSVFYLCNPLDNDFHTNYMFIRQLVDENSKMC